MPPAPESRSETYECALLWQHCLFDETTTPSTIQEWTQWVLAEAQKHRARPLALIGSTLVFCWDAVDCRQAIELALSIVAKAHGASHLQAIGCGIAVGTVQFGVANHGLGHVCTGGALDRAQHLATQASQQGILVDSGAQARLSERYLFCTGTVVNSLQAYRLDLDQPRKSSCRRAVHALHPLPIPSVRNAHFAAVGERLAGQTQRHIVFRTDSPFEPIEWLARHAQQARPPLQLHLRAQASGLQPLGSLQAALLRPPHGAPLDDALQKVDANQRQTLQAIMAGEAVQRGPAVRALTALLEANGDNCWVILHRLHDVDAATLGVLAESKAVLRRPFLLFCCAPKDATLPQVLFPPQGLFEVQLKDLAFEQRQECAAAVLGVSQLSSVARRVAQLSDPTPLGILESCRTLVTSGDLVPTEQGFRWRVGPRGGQDSIPIEALLAERVAGAPALAYRMLEVLVVTASSASSERVVQVAQRDGLSAQQAREGLALLQRETFLDESQGFGSFEYAVRMAVRNTMPPARSAELHRFAAEVLSEQLTSSDHKPGFESALLAYHRAEGGLAHPAAHALLDAAESALACGFQRMAVRLAASAVQLDQAPEHRDRARRMMRQVDRSQKPEPTSAQAHNASTTPTTPVPEVPEVPEEVRDDYKAVDQQLARKSIREAVDAIRNRDIESVERHLDSAVAAGSGRGAVRRIHAMALLSKHDLDGAMSALQQPDHPGAHPGERARQILSWSLLMLESGQPEQAVRSALTSLHLSRQQQEERGVRAALLVLSACYAALGDQDSAQRLSASAQVEPGALV